MDYRRISGLSAPLLLLLAVTVGSARAAETPFDATYSGPMTVTSGSEPVCGKFDPGMTITLKDGKFDYRYAGALLTVEVAAGGAFSGQSSSGGGRSGRLTMTATGAISGGRMEADFVTDRYHEPVCAYHWSLQKK